MPETSARELIHEIGTAARRASRITACASTEKKNAALERIAQALMTRRDVIQAANAVDLANARSEGLSAAFVDRLAVTDRVLDQMATGVRQIAELAASKTFVLCHRASASAACVCRSVSSP